MEIIKATRIYVIVKETIQNAFSNPRIEMLEAFYDKAAAIKYMNEEYIKLESAGYKKYHIKEILLR